MEKNTLYQSKEIEGYQNNQYCTNIYNMEKKPISN